jgi:hypothetical protein
VKKRRRIRDVGPPPPRFQGFDLREELRALRIEEAKRLAKATHEFDKADGALQAYLLREARKAVQS